MADPEDPLIYRYEVPVDGQWHEITLTAGTKVLHVAARQPNMVEFWAQHFPWGGVKARQFRAYGTGEPMPGWERFAYQGTAIVPGGSLVWHLMERVT